MKQGLLVSRRLGPNVDQEKSHRIGGNDPVAGAVSIATVIDVAPQLGADGVDQHGGQLIIQRCS